MIDEFGNSGGSGRVGRPEDDSMACPFDRGLLAAYFDGEASPPEREQVDRHLASCADCRRDLVEMRAAVTRVKSLPRVKAPPALALHVAAAISGRRAGGAAPARWFPAVAGAAAAALVVAGVLILVNRTSETPADLSMARSAEAPRPSSGPSRKAARSAPSGDSDIQPLSSGMRAEPESMPTPPPLPRAAEAEGFAQAESRYLKPDGLEMKKQSVDRSPDFTSGTGGAAGAAPAPPAVPSAEPAAKKADEAAAGAEPRILQIAGKQTLAQMRVTVAQLLQKSNRPVAPSAQFGSSDFAQTHYLEVEMSDAELENFLAALRKSELTATDGSLATELRRVAPHEKEATASKVSPGAAPEAKRARAAEAGRPAAGAPADPKAKEDAPPRRKIILSFVEPPTK